MFSVPVRFVLSSAWGFLYTIYIICCESHIPMFLLGLYLYSVNDRAMINLFVWVDIHLRVKMIRKKHTHVFHFFVIYWYWHGTEFRIIVEDNFAFTQASQYHVLILWRRMKNIDSDWLRTYTASQGKLALILLHFSRSTTYSIQTGRAIDLVSSYAIRHTAESYSHTGIVEVGDGPY